MSYKQAQIEVLAGKIKKTGFRVFLAESKTHGFFTDEAGNCVVSFRYDIGGIHYSGNYRSKSCSTGWRLDENLTFDQMLRAYPPQWATNGESVKLWTLYDHLNTYQSASKYKEIL